VGRTINPLTPELNLSAQRCRDFLMGILIFKLLTARRLYKSFDDKGLRHIFQLRLSLAKRFAGLYEYFAQTQACNSAENFPMKNIKL
jgi:hypothetical protein